MGSEAGKGRLLDLGRMSANDAKTVYSGDQVQVSRFFRCIALAMVSVAKLIIEFTHHLGQSLLDLSGPATDLGQKIHMVCYKAVLYHRHPVQAFHDP